LTFAATVCPAPAPISITARRCGRLESPSSRSWVRVSAWLR
jgi:hypothetical protein